MRMGNGGVTWLRPVSGELPAVCFCCLTASRRAHSPGEGREAILSAGVLSQLTQASVTPQISSTPSPEAHTHNTGPQMTIGWGVRLKGCRPRLASHPTEVLTTEEMSTSWYWMLPHPGCRSPHSAGLI